MNHQEEQQLVREAQENVEKFEELYALYFQKVYGFVASKINNRDLAEDLVSEIFIKILEGLPRYQFRGLPFGAWVFRIVRNHLKDFYAKTSRAEIGNLEDADWIQDENTMSDPAKQARRKNLKENLIASFHVLTPAEKEVVQLKYFAELSNKEIADTSGISANHVGVHIFRALKKLKNVYNDN